MKPTDRPSAALARAIAAGILALSTTADAEPAGRMPKAAVTAAPAATAQAKPAPARPPLPGRKPRAATAPAPVAAPANTAADAATGDPSPADSCGCNGV